MYTVLSKGFALQSQIRHKLCKTMTPMGLLVEHIFDSENVLLMQCC